MKRHPRNRFPWLAPAAGPPAWSLAVLLALRGSVAAAADPPVRPSAKPSPVTARLLADPPSLFPTGPVAPGAPSSGAGQAVTLGVHLHMDPAWHTYWKNGGDAGLPTQVTWELPAGASAGELRWPAPHRYEEAGDLVTYGYTDDVVLLASFAPPPGLREGDRLTVRAKVSWLMCKDLCIPGNAEISLQLPVTAKPAATPQRDALLLAQARARLPRPADQWPGLSAEQVLSLSAVPPGQSAHAALRVRGLATADSARITWFPEYLEVLQVGAAVHRVLAGAGATGPELVVVVPLQVAQNAPAGETVHLRGVLQLEIPQADPVFADIDVPIPVAGPQEAVRAVATDLFGRVLVGEASALAGDGAAGGAPAAPAAAGGLLGPPPAGQPARTSTHRPLAYYVLLALVGGLILNVMPCVLPVLSLKVLGFVQHAGEDRRTVLRLSLFFSAGVLASFAALAIAVIALQAAGEQLGWGFQFQNPVFVVVMAAVVFAFGLSLFGVYEVILPVQIGAAGKGSAGAESFVSGLLATALATPCTAPFLGTALGFAFTQPAWAILAIFLAIGAGLALPYVVLSLNPAWLRVVPKPGPWMDRFKQAMGFLLMATLVWLLWVLGNQRGLNAVVWTLAFLLAVGLALWLYGSLLTLSSGSGRRLVVWGAMIVIVAGAWWAFLREPLRAEAVAANAGSSPAPSSPQQGKNGLTWVPFDLAMLEQSVRGGRTVFIDFTAQWCWTCKVNERTVLADAAVGTRLKDLQVLTMKGDWTNRDPVITQVLRRFGRGGVPFYAVFPAGRLEEPIVLPELITKDIVLDALEKAGPSRTAQGWAMQPVSG
jgi:thiol:disulfide interchange protein